MGRLSNDKSLVKEEWNRFIRKGGIHALESVYNEYYDKLYNYGRKHGFRAHLIEDAIQNLFVSLIKSRKKLGKIDKLFSYLICSFRNELFRLGTKERSFSLSEGLQKFTVAEYNMEDEIIRQEVDLNIQNLLLTIIKKLPPSQQEILYMRFYSGLGYEEISEILGISIESCRTSIYRSLKTIREDVEVLKRSGAVFYL